MKSFLYAAGMVMVLCSFRISADSDGIVSALKKGNADMLSAYFDNIIDVKLPGKDEVKGIGKNQATITLKDFFTQNRINDFELTSQREMSGTMYMAGKLKNSGSGYNITLMMKTRGDKLSIITIRIN
jgi:opacity protein-like surface antigen